MVASQVGVFEDDYGYYKVKRIWHQIIESLWSQTSEIRNKICKELGNRYGGNVKIPIPLLVKDKNFKHKIISRNIFNEHWCYNQTGIHVMDSYFQIQIKIHCGKRTQFSLMELNFKDKDWLRKQIFHNISKKYELKGFYITPPLFSKILLLYAIANPESFKSKRQFKIKKYTNILANA